MIYSQTENHEQNFELDRMYEFAITDKNSGQLYGAIGISNHKQYQNGEIAYWIGESRIRKCNEKVRNVYDGTLKEHIYKEGSFEDIVLYGLIHPMR